MKKQEKFELKFNCHVILGLLPNAIFGNSPMDKLANYKKMKQNKEKKTLILIDGNALAHRAFHALPPLSSKGKLTNAVFGFASILLKIIKDFSPEYIVCTFDLAEPTFRHEQYEKYKANRVHAPQDFYDQLPDIKEIVKAFSIPIYEKAGFEADDVIGTIKKLALTEAAEKEIDLEIIIVTGDLDTLQLVNSRTKVYTPKKGIKDMIIYDECAVQERFGLNPSQMNDFKGLKGDPSDNIPGISGIGEKTAANLIKEFSSLEKLYEKIAEMEEIGATKQGIITSSIFKKLLGGKDQAFFSRELSIINDQTPIDFKLETAHFSLFDYSKAEEILKNFNFFSLIPRLPKQANQKETANYPSKEDTDTSLSDNFQEIFSQIDELHKQEIFSDGIVRLEKKLTPILKEMQDNGIKIDIEHLQNLSAEFSKQLSSLENQIWTNAGTEFNISSPQQLSEILFKKLNLKTDKLKKTPGGVISTSASELEKLKNDHSIIQLVCDYREIFKLKSTYIDSLLALQDENHRIHTTFHQLGTSTGRISSSNPNLQNIPIRTENGQSIRKAFISEKGYKLIKADYSQIELRIIACMAEDKKMIDIFTNGGDIHKATAAEVAEIPIEQVTPELRRTAKALNFGVIYGMGAQGFANSAGISKEKAKEFIDSYMKDFGGVAAWIERTKQFAQKHGYVQTLFGRRRYIPELRSETPYIKSSGERMAINMPVQGTAADIVKMAIIKIDQELKEAIQKKEIKLLLQVHDELVFEIKDNLVEKYAPKIKEIMENVYDKLPIKLEVDVKIGDNW